MNLPLLVVAVMVATIHIDHTPIVVPVGSVQADSVMEFDTTPVCVEIPALMPVMTVASVGIDPGTRMVPMGSTHAEAMRVSDEPCRAIEVPLLVVVRPVAVVHPNPAAIVVSLVCIQTLVAMSRLDSGSMGSQDCSSCIFPPSFVVSFPDLMVELVLSMALSMVDHMALVCHLPPHLMPPLSLMLVSISDFLPHALVSPPFAVSLPLD